MYTQWLKVCATNRALVNENQELCGLKNKAECKVQQLEALVAEKDEKLKSIATELKRTPKALRLLNNGTNMLDYLITSGKSFGDHSGIGFKGESSSIKTISIKSRLLVDSIDASNYKHVIRSIAIEGKYAVYCNRSVSEIFQSKMKR